MSEPTPDRFTLRALPLPAKLVVTAFLLAVGLGYSSAMVQLHMQHASPGNFLPTPEDAERIFAGKTQGERPKSKVEVVLEAPEDQPFNGTGQTMHLVSSYSMSEGARGFPRVIELQVVPSDRSGWRLIANEVLYTGPGSTATWPRTCSPPRR